MSYPLGPVAIHNSACLSIILITFLLITSAECVERRYSSYDWTKLVASLNQKCRDAKPDAPTN